MTFPSANQKSGHPVSKGIITAHPNPAPLMIPSGLISTTLQWISSGTNLVEVRIGKPDGPLFSQSEGSGCAETGQWVCHGMTFFLQDVSNGKPLLPENTLSTVSIQTALELLTPSPDLYPFTAYLAQRFGCSHIICIGNHDMKHMAPFQNQFEVIGIDCGDGLKFCRKENPSYSNLENTGESPLKKKVLEKSIILCTNIDRFNNIPVVLGCIKNLMDYAPVCVLSRPAEKNNMEQEFKDYNVAFRGKAARSILDFSKEAQTAILERNNVAYNSSTPEEFTVIALMTAYNEEDIIVSSIQHLIDQGIDVYLIDNWSTDQTCALAKNFLGKGVIGVEKFPADLPPPYFSLEDLLRRVEQLTAELRADWFIHHDVDEIRESPWAEVSLRDAFFKVDQAGFNCIDHTVVEFLPTNNDFTPGADFNTHFDYFEFGSRPGDFLQIKAWKNSGQAVSLADSGGHEVCFEGRRVYPYKFLLKHYQIRSQSHGEKKVYKERKARWNPSEKAKGWHAHYDDFREGHSFIRSAAELEYFDEAAFHQKYLIERLSGTGILRKILVAQKTNSVAAPDDASANLKLINDLVCRNDRLSAQIEDLEIKKKEHELFLKQLSNKWYIRCIVFINRLLGRAHRLKSYDSVKTI